MINKTKLLTPIFIIIMALAKPQISYADQEVCTQSYGQPVVCGVKKEEIIVKAGLKEDLRYLGFGLILGSIGLYLYSKRVQKISSMQESDSNFFFVKEE